MLCSDTDFEHEAVHLKHLNARTTSQLDRLIGALVDVCRGDGNINLVITGGKIRRFEPTSKVPVDDKKSA